MQYEDLRLEGFFPALLVPPETTLSISIAFDLVVLSIFLSTWHNVPGTLIQLFIAPFAVYYFLDYGFGNYVTHGPAVQVALAVVGVYGVMRVLETTFVGLLDAKLPYWIVEGKEAPMPTSLLGRLAYAIDLTTSLRGNSWFANTHWNWAPRALSVNSPTRFMTRSQFQISNLLSLIQQYLAYDILDTINKSRTWDTSSPYPITSLPWYEQIIFSTSVCACTALSITVPYTVVSSIFVLLGSYPGSWPPMFDAPFTATSLADFWTKRWHAIFRRVFERLSIVVLRVVPAPKRVQHTIRSLLVFSLSASLHIMIIYRVDMSQTEHPRTFLDPSILKFFLSQPPGLALEILFVLPLCNTFLTPRWRNVVTRIWTWVFLLWAGRFWSDVWVGRGFWGPTQRCVGWSVVRGVLYGQWAI